VVEEGSCCLSSVPVRSCLLLVSALNLPTSPTGSRVYTLLPTLLRTIPAAEKPALVSLVDLICHMSVPLKPGFLLDLLVALEDREHGEEGGTVKAPMIDAAVIHIITHRPQVSLLFPSVPSRLKGLILPYLPWRNVLGNHKKHGEESTALQKLPCSNYRVNGDSQSFWPGGCLPTIHVELRTRWPKVWGILSPYLMEDGPSCCGLCGPQSNKKRSPPQDTIVGAEPRKRAVVVVDPLVDPAKVFAMEILMNVFSYLSPKRLAKVAYVSQSWATAAMDEKLWHAAYLRKWPKTSCASSLVDSSGAQEAAAALNKKSMAAVSSMACPRLCSASCHHCMMCGGHLGGLQSKTVRCVSQVSSWRKAFVQKRRALARKALKQGHTSCNIAGCAMVTRSSKSATVSLFTSCCGLHVVLNIKDHEPAHLARLVSLRLIGEDMKKMF